MLSLLSNVCIVGEGVITDLQTSCLFLFSGCFIQCCELESIELSVL